MTTTLAQQLTAAGQAVGERLWRMPLDKSYDEHLEIAHCRTSSIMPTTPDPAMHRMPPPCLKQFVEDRPWAHLDIAGREFAGKDRTTCPAGGTGYAVQLLEQFVAKAEGIIDLASTAGRQSRPAGFPRSSSKLTLYRS